MEKTQVTWTQTDRGLGSYLEDLGARLGSVGTYLSSLGGYIARLGEALWGVKPTLHGKASVLPIGSKDPNPLKLPKHLNPAQAPDDKSLWRRATRLRFNLECSELYADIENHVLENGYRQADEMAPEGGPLRLADVFFCDITREASWDFDVISGNEFSVQRIWSGDPEAFQKRWYEEVKRLTPNTRTPEDLAREVSIFGNQTSLLDGPKQLAGRLLGTEKMLVGTNDPGYRLVDEDGKLFMEASVRLYVHGGEHQMVREGEAALKFRMPLSTTGCKPVFLSVDFSRYDKPMPPNQSVS